MKPQEMIAALSQRIINFWHVITPPIIKTLRAVLGNMNWQPPAWINWVRKRVIQAITAVVTYLRNRPRHAAIVSGSVLLGMALLVVGWRWYQAQPKPLEVSFTVSRPAITCYSCEPPGKPNALHIQFDNSVAPVELSGHVLDLKKSHISIDPQIAGEWRWEDDHTLTFQPAVDWAVGQNYEVSIARKGVVAPQIRLQKYSFEFESAAFAAHINNTEFYQDPEVAANKKVVVNVKFTHAVDPERFEKRIAIKMFSRETDTREIEVTPPHYTVVYDKLKLNAFIHSDKLDVPPKAGRLEITIDSGLQAARGGNKTNNPLHSSVDVPGLNSLKINAVSLNIARDERNEPQQVLTINASHSVLERDMPAKVKAWLLPEKNPDTKRQAEYEKYNHGRPYPWNKTNVTPEVIAAATPLELKQDPGELEHYEIHGFRYHAPPGRMMYVRVEQGLKSFGGYILGNSVENILTVPEFPRELQLLHQGSLLALSGDKHVTFFSRNVPAIKLDIGRVLPKQIQYLVTQTIGSFTQPAFQSLAFKDTDITEHFSKIIKLPATAPGESHYESVDLSEYLDNEGEHRGMFLLRAQAWNADNDQPVSGGESQWNNASAYNLSDTRLIVVTDLGMLVKRANDGSQDVFVQSIKTGEPVAGTTIDILGRNGLTVMSEVTGNDGHVHFGDLRQLRNERQAVVYLAHRSGDSSFMPVEQRDRMLDMSRFDVGGVESSTDRNALTAYVFSDRGLYRPGETIHVASIIRSQDWSRSLRGVPMMLEVTDPRGTVIRRETFAPGSAGFSEITQDTKISSPTGTYTFSITTVRNGDADNVIGSTTVKVRDFQPDRLRMNAHFSNTLLEGWVSPDKLAAEVQLNNLFGTPAQQRRVTATMTLSPALPAFRNFADYQFYDPQYAKEGFSEELSEAQTDDQGHASLILNLQRFARATYRVHLLTQGFEADGGRGVSAETTQLVSNMPYLVGYKADGDLNFVARNADRKIKLIAIDPELKHVAVGDLKLSRIELRYVSVLVLQSSGVYKYESRRKEVMLDTKPLSIAADGAQLPLVTDVPGNFAYVIRDANDQSLSRIEYQVAGDANVTRRLEKNAELELTLSKPDYVPGEEVELSIRAPYAGAGLITIEREKVVAWRWFKTTTTSSVQHITVPKDMEGNAYVSVSFVRDPSSDEIYTSPLSYGVKPFSIATGARQHQVEVKTATLIKPGQTMKLHYHTDSPSRVVLFAVDEGILQVANYEKPDPLNFFFQKRALQVTSTQILDLILPTFKQLGLNAAPGGDAEGLIGRNLNPFRRKGEAPVVFWSGVIDADSKDREVQYTVPDYFNGNLKVFAVAVSDARIGVAATDVTVRGDFVITPTAPTTVTPGDEFEISAGIANNLQGSGSNAKLKLTLNTDGGLAVVGNATQELSIAEGREGVARFVVKARDRLGASEMKFVASAGDSTVTRHIDLSIRPATPHMTALSAGTFRNGTQDIKIERSLYPNYRKLNAGVSLLPLSLAHGLVSYLSDYPYVCTEQIVSQAMPAIILGTRPEFGYVKKLNGADLSTLISELRARQNENGAYKLWPAGAYVDEFASLYAQHFLLEAKERGENIPLDLLTQGNNYLQQIAIRDGNNLTEERHSAYAIYLLTRQGRRTSAELSALQKRLDTCYAKEWSQDLVSAWMAASMSLMKQDRDAERLIKSVKFNAGTKIDASNISNWFDDVMTRDGLLLYINARYFPSRLTQLPDDVLTQLVARINQGYFHTLSIGASLLALDAYATATDNQTATLSIHEILRDKSEHAITLPTGLFPKVPFTEQASMLRFGNNSQLNAYYLVEQSGFERSPPTEAIKQGMEIIREYTDANGKSVTQAKLGDELTVHVKFRNLSKRRINVVALVDLLPGGFELVVPSKSTEHKLYQASTESSTGTEAPTDNSAEPADDNETETNDTENNNRSSNVYAGEEVSAWNCQVCTASTTASLQYADMREDRMVFYTYAENDIREVSYKIKATNVGTFVLPPAYGEAMYDRSVIARSAVASIKVDRQ